MRQTRPTQRSIPTGAVRVGILSARRRKFPTDSQFPWIRFCLHVQIRAFLRGKLATRTLVCAVREWRWIRRVGKNRRSLGGSGLHAVYERSELGCLEKNRIRMRVCFEGGWGCRPPCRYSTGRRSCPRARAECRDHGLESRSGRPDPEVKR